LHLFLQRDLMINFAQTRLGTLRYIFAITDSGPEPGAGGRETGRAPAWETRGERPMANLLPFFPSAAFDHNATRAMGKAFDRACHSLHDIGQPDLVREIIAKRIVEVARDGERDPDELCARALKALGFSSFSNRQIVWSTRALWPLLNLRVARFVDNLQENTPEKKGGELWLCSKGLTETRRAICQE
jgi:hypothetical protein